MIRLKDIALRAGVSVMTVSKVLRDAPDISPTTKARIRLLAEQMGYVPDSLAQGLRTRTTKLLGLVISAVTNPVQSRITMALEEHAHALGYDLILSHSQNIPEREESCIRRLLSRRVDGLFISPVYRMTPNVPIYDEVQRCGTPTVILGHKAPFCQQFVNFESDDLSGSYAATKYLIGLGHRRIAFFAGPTVSPAAQERCEGYRRALRDANLEVNDGLIFRAGASIDDGQKAAVQMLDETTGATAVQAHNDLVAIGAASAFIDRGLKIPADISIVGFGDIAVAELFKIPLTTVHQPKFRLGLAAVEAMAKLLRGEKAEAKRLPAELVVRSSSGPAISNRI